jgi:guanylate kinase
MQLLTYSIDMSKGLDNKLNLDRIKVLLKNYEPKKVIINELSKIKLTLLVAPTAAGRNSVINYLVELGDYHYIVSDTTRSPRRNNGELEKNGQVYWFKEEKDFLNSLRKGEYIEAAVIHGQQASGINIAELRRAKSAGKYAITDIDFVGCDSIIRLSHNVIPVFLLPPSFEIWMKRLKGRGFLSEEELKRRLTSARKEFEYAINNNFLTYVINDNLQDTVHKIDSLVRYEKILENQKTSKKLLKELLRNLN